MINEASALLAKPGVVAPPPVVSPDKREKVQLQTPFPSRTEPRNEGRLLVAGAKPGPHAIAPEGEERTLRDTNLGEVPQSARIFGAEGYFASGGGSPLCGITSVMNVITKFRRDWGVPSPFEDQAHEQLFLMEKFLPMLGLDVHQDVIDHGTGSSHFELVIRAYLRDQLGLVPTTEWIRRRADHVPAALREAFHSGMAVAATVSFSDRGGGHWILLGGPGPDDQFFVCDPNYPRPLWGSKMRAVPVPGGSQNRMKATPTGDYIFTGLLAIGARGEAPAEIARMQYRHRDVDLVLSVAPDGWARLEASFPGGPDVRRCGWVPLQSIAKLTQEGQSERRTREAIDEIANALLRTESSPFQAMHLRVGDRSIRVEDGTLVVESNDERTQRRLSLIELELLREGTRRMKMRPTRGSQIAPIPRELTSDAPNFSLGVTPPRSKTYLTNIGVYGGSTSGRLGDYGELHDRLDPLLNLLVHL